MAQFHPLTVTDIQKTTRDAVVVTLTPDSPPDFAFTQGQYLTFRRDFDGQELRRSYSICAAPDDGVLQVGIKHVAGGAFSTWANGALAVGDVIEAMPPMGSFYRAEAAGPAHHLAFAAGSGITPVLSILRTVLKTNAMTQATLVYANRNPNTVMFREELEDLKNTYMDRLILIHVLSEDTQGIDLFQGRIDADKCAALFAHWIDLPSVTTAYICGPEPMMHVIKDSLKAHGMARDQIRFELFGSQQPGRLPQPIKFAGVDEKGVSGRVIIAGEARPLVIPQGTSLLDAALQDNLDAPYACKAGVCSTCKAKVLEGEVEMIANHALEDYEVEQGYVLTCQCYPVADQRVVWDYDASGH